MHSGKLQHFIWKLNNCSFQSFCNALRASNTDPEVFKDFCELKNRPMQWLEHASLDKIDVLITYFRVNEREY